jgi:hypothetical protein
MEKYYFVYSVDAVTIDGDQETAGMILDHAELTDTISYYQASGAAVSGVFVTMYDCKGDEVKTRDISRMVINN